MGDSQERASGRGKKVDHGPEEADPHQGVDILARREASGKADSPTSQQGRLLTPPLLPPVPSPPPVREGRDSLTAGGREGLLPPVSRLPPPTGRVPQVRDASPLSAREGNLRVEAQAFLPLPRPEGRGVQPQERRPRQERGGGSGLFPERGVSPPFRHGSGGSSLPPPEPLPHHPLLPGVRPLLSRPGGIGEALLLAHLSGLDEGGERPLGHQDRLSGPSPLFGVSGR